MNVNYNVKKWFPWGDRLYDRIYIIIILSNIHKEWSTQAYKIDVCVYMCECMLT